MRTHELRFTFKGHSVEASIKYSSKDYNIQIHKPVEAKLPGKHIMAMLPAVYVIEKQSDIELGQILLESRCIKEIKDYLSNLDNFRI